MANNTPITPATAPHMLSLSNRKELHLTGVSEVLAFDETLVCLKTSCGNMDISGKSLHVHSLHIDDGNLSLSGEIDSILYKSHAGRSKKSLRELLK